ncbi:MAG TPA: DUF1499 domain-containing protein [Dongiaceae bacterium]|nr:DUF1499 domain-containing protein [Dongiaceae bacterium]
MTPWKAVGIGCGLLIVVLGLLLWDGRFPERFFVVGKLPDIDFRTLERQDTPNQYLMCTNQLCTAYIDDLPPIYSASVHEVRAAWEKVLSREPRVKELHRDLQAMQIDYVQRSLVWRFPDIITIRFIPIGENKTTIAIYSRSVYGQGDFGVNKARIRAWVAKLNAMLPLG